MSADPKVLEEQAYKFLYEERFDDAFRLFRKTALLYQEQGNHQQAALCFASAGSCWGIRSGERSFIHAASSYESAAKEAQLVGDFEYAAMLFRHAAINFERDMEFVNFSECLYRSKECFRRFLTWQFFKPKKIHVIAQSEQIGGVKGFLHNFFRWVVLTMSFLVWGHGERPIRTLCTAACVIFFSSLIFWRLDLVYDGLIIKPTFFQALYFSAITFTTVGYGDITPTGVSRFFAGLEAFFGLFVPALFVVALSRKYLRV